ncbi:MAG: PEP-CTERM sorting domain-containing protein [Cyanobacteria bacterium SBLK]|nr:PEP-CTERM sorting domain-containing protein [Cyanobacteria bacterium SBLK]
MKRIGLGLSIGSLVALAIGNSVQAATITQTLGDSDFFGFGNNTIGNPVPIVDFNNQEPDDPAFSDRDIREQVIGSDPQNDVGWTHDLSSQLTNLTAITDFTLELAIGGIQDADPSLGSVDDRLFIEGIEVLGAFDTVDQGALGTDLLSFSLTTAQIASFQTDSILDIFIDGGQVPPDASQTGAIGALDSYFIDFSRITVETDDNTSVPEPSTILGLVALGLFGASSLRKKKQ